MSLLITVFGVVTQLSLVNLFHRITDAYNNARDRVRYLESLSPHLELLETTPPPNPYNVVSTTLPALAAAFRQMDGLSRVYAQSGYLGVLLTKVCELVCVHIVHYEMTQVLTQDDPVIHMCSLSQTASHYITRSTRPSHFVSVQC